MSENQQPQPPVFQPSPEFLARAKRMDDAMQLRKPDRVPGRANCMHLLSNEDQRDFKQGRHVPY